MADNDRNDERLRGDGGPARQDRAMVDRAVTHDREMTDAQRLELFRMRHFQQVLPDLPEIPGYHTVWLSTTNQSDTILNRERLGYQKITQADAPGWDFHKMSMKSGSDADEIRINEMVAYKISDSLYNAYMKEAHYHRPNALAAKLVQDVEQLKEQAKSNKTYLETYDGAEEIESEMRRGKPVFA